jgi:hypothetical protein
MILNLVYEWQLIRLSVGVQLDTIGSQQCA